MPNQAMADPANKTTNHAINTALDSIHFIALPYLSSLQFKRHRQSNQASILRHDKDQQALSEHQWVVSTTNIPELTSQYGQLHIIEHDLRNSYRLTADLHNIIIPVQTPAALLPPLQPGDSSPLWLRYTKKGDIAWHAPNLTPATMARIISDKKKKLQQAERLAERMADRAFYFGYDTNDDALK